MIFTILGRLDLAATANPVKIPKFESRKMNEPIIVPGHAPDEAIGPLAQSEPFSAVRLPTGLTAEIDAWANDHEISRSEAIRRRVELGLKKGK
jgi:hypothetical protein